MVHSLAARALLMMGHGAGMIDAIDWVLRRFPQNLAGYWRVVW